MSKSNWSRKVGFNNWPATLQHFSTAFSMCSIEFSETCVIIITEH